MVELMNPGGGSGSSLEVSDGTTNVNNVTEIIFSGATVSNGGGGIADVSIGLALSFETPVGTIDNANMTFTVSHTPTFIIVNGLVYTAGTGIFSSYSAPTITLSTPVGTGGFILSAY